MQHFWAFRIGEHLVYLDGRAYVHEGAFSIESLKVEVACVYYLQMSDERRVKGVPFKFYFLANFLYYVFFAFILLCLVGILVLYTNILFLIDFLIGVLHLVTF